MPFPPELDNKIRKRFEELEAEASRLSFFRHEPDSYGFPIPDATYMSNCEKLRINFITLLQLLAAKNSRFSDLVKEVSKGNPAQLHGIISGLRSDYEIGMLQSIAEVVEANVTANYLQQAEELLTANPNGQYNHVPAAVLAGAVLENSLRILCDRQNPPIPTQTDKKLKTLGTLIEDLKSAGLFNELKAKQLRAWADIRNAAAHGRFDDFKREDVEPMLKGIQNFLSDYM
jgi:hypothetical protein